MIIHLDHHVAYIFVMVGKLLPRAFIQERLQSLSYNSFQQGQLGGLAVLIQLSSLHAYVIKNAPTPNKKLSDFLQNTYLSCSTSYRAKRWL